jgi:hypothetical protein
MKHILQVLCAAVFALAGLEKAHADNLMLEWSPSDSPAVAGYDVYYGTNSGNYPYMIDAGNATSLTVSNLTPGVTYYFNATAYDAAGDQSGYSGEVSFLVPGILTVTPGATPGSPSLIQFPVAPGHWYEVQASTDLQNWSTIWQTDVMTSNVWTQFTDPDSASYASRFYRLVLN